MNGKNLVIIMGQLTQDCQQYTKNGNLVVKFSLPTSEVWVDKQGNKQKSIEWHSLVFFEPLSTIAAKYLQKGSVIYVEGKNKTTKWVDKNNITRYFTDIVVNELQMLDGNGHSQSLNQNQTLPSNSKKQASKQQLNPKKADDHMDEPLS